MNLADVFAPAEAKYKAQVMANTWGHSHPPPGDHEISIIYVHGCYGDCTVLDVYYPTMNDSPWLYAAIANHTNTCPADRGEMWSWTGTIRWFKNGGHRFIKGKWKRHVNATHPS